MKQDIFNQICNYFYTNQNYQKDDFAEYTSETLILLLDENFQKKLEDLGIADDFTALIKYLKRVIFFKKHLVERKNSFKMFVRFSSLDTETISIIESQHTENTAFSEEDDLKYEIDYLLQNLKTDEIELLVDIASGKLLKDIAIEMNTSYDNIRQKSSRLKKKCKNILDEAFLKDF